LSNQELRSELRALQVSTSFRCYASALFKVATDTQAPGTIRLDGVGGLDQLATRRHRGDGVRDVASPLRADQGRPGHVEGLLNQRDE
jgi:hypothetical protein